MPNYHNFKIQANCYISKAGHDSNPGSDPNAPRKSFSALPGGTVFTTYALGAGVYKAASFPLQSVIADGRVRIETVDGNYTSIYSSATSAPTIYEGIEFYKVHLGNVSQDRGASWRKCIMDDCIGPSITSVTSRSAVILDSVIKNTYGGKIGPVLSTQGRMSYAMNVIINANIVAFSIKDCYVDKDSIIEVGDYFNFSSGNNSHCCIRGKIVVKGVAYEVKRKKDGAAAAGTNPSIKDIAECPEWIAAGFNPYTDNKLFNEDPKFNDASVGDYTLQADSPLIRAASDGFSNIGGYFARVGSIVKNTDDGNASGVSVLPSGGIDASNPSAFILKAGETEAYVDYVFPLPGLPLSTLDVADLFDFNTDFPGGTLQNSNVVDAEPRTSEYAQYVPTNAAASDTSTLKVPAGVIQVGKHVWVNGQGREVIGKSTSGNTDTLALSAPLLATIGAGVDVTFGAEQQLAALSPNRLTNWLRTKSTPEPPSIPLVDAEWDNEVHASFGVAGKFFNQELGAKPGLIVYNGQVWGTGDSAAPLGVQPSEIAGLWGNCRVFKRNNQSSKGLPWPG